MKPFGETKSKTIRVYARSRQYHTCRGSWFLTVLWIVDRGRSICDVHLCLYVFVVSFSFLSMDLLNSVYLYGIDIKISLEP